MYSVLLDMVTRSVQAEQLPPLRAGAVLHATVEGPPGRLAAVSTGLRVPLPETAAFQPRQPVLIEVRDSAQGLQLVVRAATQQAPPPTPAPAQQPDLAALLHVVAQALQSAGAAAPADMAAEILPPSLPRTQPVLAQFFAPYAASTAAALADDWAVLADIAARAVAAGVLSRREAGVLNQTARGADARTAANVEAALARAQENAVPLEARIAAALASEDAEALQKVFDNDVRALLARLRYNEPFQAFLRNTGQAKLFEGAAERVLAHLTETSTQNARSLDQPYMFMQLPLPPDGPLLRAHIHVMGDGRRGREGKQAATVALDLSTARLGDLWIALTSDGERCGCLFRAQTAEAVEALRTGASDLEGALKKAGYGQANVRAELWDGNRVEALAAYLRPFSGLNVEA